MGYAEKLRPHRQWQWAGATTPQCEGGFVLAIGMIMMLILSVIGVSTLRSGILQEKMSSNYLDKEQSFQAAESALRMVQRNIQSLSIGDIESRDGFVTADAVGRYDNLNLQSPGFDVTGIHDPTDPDNSLIAHPRAFMQKLSTTESLKIGKEPANQEIAQHYYRVTAMSQGETASSFTALQGVVLR